MKISGGKNKGKRILGPDTLSSRPMAFSDKESLFFRIQDIVESSSFLDLFSGTGSVGIEAISRGASTVHFVEHDHSVLSILDRNLGSIGAHHISTIHATDVFRYLHSCSFTYDLIFAGPPNNKEFIPHLVFDLDASPSLLSKSGKVLVQCSTQEYNKITSSNTFSNLMNLKLLDVFSYSDNYLFFKKK